MKQLAISLAVSAAACLVQPAVAWAQSVPQNDKAQLRAEQRAQGTEAARNFTPGEGDPVPEAKPKVSRDERIKARQARKPEGASAAKSFRAGEGDPKPAAVAKQPADERRADRLAKRNEVKAANKAGQIPSYGDNYGQK